MANKKIKSVNFLPEFLRTDKNSKFLSGTLDQLIQKPEIERLDGFVGSKITPNYNPNQDIYINESTVLKTNYQFEPALIFKDNLNNITDSVSYDDLINEIKFNNGNIENLNSLFNTQYYSYNPFIDLDKFVNYQDYYWLPTGPESIKIVGIIQDTTSTYTVSDNEALTSFIISPNGLDEDPLLILYRGNTYNFDVNSQYQFYIKSQPTISGSSNLYNIGVTNNGTSTGIVSIVVDDTTPDLLYYVGKDSPSTVGKIIVKTIDENSFLDVEKEIIGKKLYTSGNGVSLSNGMKITFGGVVYPEKYRNKNYFVEGVGNQIELVDYEKLISSDFIADIYNDNFDASPFDTFPFDSFKNLPLDPEYISINRSSKDLNQWSRYNRWFHKDIIEQSALFNKQLPIFPVDKRAKRPIIEFVPNIKLFNYGIQGIDNVDYIDESTTDVFSNVEGSAGYYVDQELLQQGNTVIFNEDADPLVQGKIFEVNYNIINGKKVLNLILKDDLSDKVNPTVCINNGVEYSGSSWWFNGTKWIYAQQHDKLNQPPLFDLFDNNGVSYNRLESSFNGTKIFGYSEGTYFDRILGFGVKLENSVGIGSYVFKSYLMTDSFSIFENNQNIQTISAEIGYLKITNNNNNSIFKNSWDSAYEYKSPIIQNTVITESTSSVLINSVEFNNSNSILLNAYIDNRKIDSADYQITTVNKSKYVNFVDSISTNSNLLLKIYTDNIPTNQGYFETPLSLTNNPNNMFVDELTLSEISDHLKTAIENINNKNTNKLRDISDINLYANRIIKSKNPINFSQFFIGKKENSIIDAIDFGELQYSQFKLSLIKTISEISDETLSRKILDKSLKIINQNKDFNSSYFYSDMLGYGSDSISRNYKITDTLSKIFPLPINFNLNVLSLQSILIYKNGIQLVNETEYHFINDESIELLINIEVGDDIEVVFYNNTEGCFVPPTPTKLGLYPKFEPKIFYDDTYIDGPTNVIQGHDGSITIAFNDYRDDVLLEYEKRIFNNIKSTYKNEFLDYNIIIPNAFRKTDYNVFSINQILQKSFFKWVGLYGVDYSKNSIFDIDNSYTWNYRDSYIQSLDIKTSGHWRNIYKFLYDTDKPHTHPWEMLGFSIKPSWWDEEYGDAPYTSGNEILWYDIENGIIKKGDRKGVDPLYIRKNLNLVLPVDDSGNLKNPLQLGISNINPFKQKLNWVFGDHSPAETVWRKSSSWPFAVQKLLALTKPTTYCSLMYDVSRLSKNIANQVTYGDLNKFLSLKNIVILDNQVLTSGFSVLISEYGKQINVNYINELKSYVENYDINLYYKLGGFTSKNKIQILMDAFDPVSNSPGSILPNEDFKIILNESNPIQTFRISGIIIQKSNGKFVVKGYDQTSPYFTVYTPQRNITTPAITIGGISESYINWSDDNSSGSTNLSNVDTTTAVSATYGKFYQQGQNVFYKNNFYRVRVSHRSDGTFNTSYFQILPSLPIVGGATVQVAKNFDTKEILIQYGTELQSIQEVYDLIIGYGAWLESKGFVFDDYNKNLNEILDWNFSAKEFLYWTTQNWADNSLISISPFSNQIKFKIVDSVIDDIFNKFYDYGLLQVNGLPYPKNFITVNRDDEYCIIKTTNDLSGIYFARLNSVQKEHGIVFNNKTIFNDTILDLETGYRQKRVKITGFKTSNWNGDFNSPGFIYDSAKFSEWSAFKDYKYADTVTYSNKYYSAKNNVNGSSTFNFNDWVLLSEKPDDDLLPNFDYKISQFEDFYSLDIDNFDESQKIMAQHLIGYTPRVYLNNIFSDKIAQYKFYQGFIKEKGTKNSLTKLAKATLKNLQGEIDFKEEWAFRIGSFGSYETFKEFEFPLVEGTFYENPQIIKFVDQSISIPNDLIAYKKPNDFVLKPDDYISSSTFITINSTFDDTNFKLKTAGYVRLDDIDATALNEDSLIDIANNSLIPENTTIWIGYKNIKEWDVLRYENTEVRIISATSNSDDSEIIFKTDNFHNLNVGDIISIIQFDTATNGVYKVSRIKSLTEFVITKSIEGYEVLESTLSSPGLLFKFGSIRFNNYNNIISDNKLLNAPYGTNYWIDRDLNNKWVVYKKTKNYIPSFNKVKIGANSDQFGKKIFKQKNSSILLASAPQEVRNSKFGMIYFYEITNDRLFLRLKYTLNENISYNDNSINYFGNTLYYDNFNFNNTDYGLIFAGAPYASRMKSNGVVGGFRYTTGTEIASVLNEEGALKISSINPLLFKEQTEVVLLSPTPTNYQRFGSSVFVEANTSSKILVVGAPSSISTGTGNVYAYSLNVISDNITITTSTYDLELFPPIALVTGDQWGYSISGNKNASVIAISAPGTIQDTGAVYIFNKDSYIQTLPVPSNITQKSRFGENVLVSDNGDKIIVSAPYSDNNNLSKGSVIVYDRINSTNTFTITQIITNPVEYSEMNFGLSFDINEDKNLLAISAVGRNKFVKTTFDNYSKSTNIQYINDSNSLLNQNITSFDSGSVEFFDQVDDSGTVYLYDNKNTRYALCDEIRPVSPIGGDDYGYSVVIDNDRIYVGAPSLNTNLNISGFYNFDRINKLISGYEIYRSQDNLIDIDLIRKNSIIDTVKEQIIDYLDIFDPLKGKIVGIADQEIKYKSFSDPAIYTIGSNEVIVDSNRNWLDEQVGNLWWDLSTVKYFWYEQGELSYRKNSWGKIFPGCTIDVYEWVRSEYLPSEWSALADTPNGLTKSISGQPKYIDNTVVSVKQIVNPLSGSYSNVYYYWVKNKVTIPAVKNRRISSFQVSSLISDPVANGMKLIEILSKDSVALANISPILNDSKINLNISYDSIGNRIPKHTEWLLLEENSDKSFPNTLLTKKLFDSLLGRDNIGNLIPDPNIPFRNRYGISIRPRQSLFKDRFAALRNLIEFANSVFIKYPITDKSSFINLNKQEEIPNFLLNQYDLLVVDNEFLVSGQIETKKLETAQLKAKINNGRIISVTIENAGFGYIAPPSVTIISDVSSSAEIKTTIDSFGRVVSVSIVNSGNNYIIAPELFVRPFTVIVENDSTSRNRWAKYEYNKSTGGWIKIATQKFNTTLYWDYIDWKSDSYNQYVDYEYTLNNVYEINKLQNVTTGQYIKIINGGDNRFIILEKTDINEIGDFSNDYNLVYSQNGTIKIKDDVWDFENNNLSYDTNLFDETLYDQTPDIETEYILKAIKDDIFINDLKINWNLFFFKAVKYAISEQKFLDWVFKTSFINVINDSGNLDQRPTYKLQNSSYYEDYIKEAKPFHSVIRNFTAKFDSIDFSNTYVTDFDLPSKYNVKTDNFDPITISDELTNSYPWKSWKDNYSLFIDRIIITNSGSGYITSPEVTIVSEDGDSGFGAKAKAYISDGKISFIEVTESGSGYTKPPKIIFSGGGDNNSSAAAYPILKNNKTRMNKIGMKFDRISKDIPVLNNNITDRFICNGFRKQFVLSWFCDVNDTNFNITLDGNVVLRSEYNIVSVVNNTAFGYSKKLSRIDFLNKIPESGQVLVVKYKKSLDILNANERIYTFYTATENTNVGLDLPQLIDGIEYSNLQLSGLDFNYSTVWGSDYQVYGDSWYGNDIDSYYVYQVTQPVFAGTDTIFVSTTTGIMVGQQANIISYSTTTNVFSTSTVQVLQVNYPQSSVRFTSTNKNPAFINQDLTSSTYQTYVNGVQTTINRIAQVEFWSVSNQSEPLDSVYESGSWTNGIFINALGINPEDVTIDGSDFYSQNVINSTEEFVPGFVADTIGINVYTKSALSPPLVFSGHFHVRTGVFFTSQKLQIVPPAGEYLTVVFNNVIFKFNSFVRDYVSDWTSTEEFTINWETNELVIPEQFVSGICTYTLLGIGGGREDYESGVLDFATMTAENTTTVQVQSLAGYNSVNSAFVSFNGISIPEKGTPGAQNYYEIVPASNDNRRAAVNITFINSPFAKNTAIAWFFSNPYKHFNEVKEQNIFIGSSPTNIATLFYPPGKIEPHVANIIVELEDNLGRRRLNPPNIEYYQVTNSLTYIYKIDNKTVRAPGTFDISNTRVYINGRTLRPGFDFTVNSTNSTVNITPTLISIRDTIAVVGFVTGEYDYNVIGDKLILSTSYTNVTIKVITFNDHDSMLVRTEKFVGNPNRRYKISRPVLNDNYVWVQVNGIPLVSGLDYEILDDQVTVQVSDLYNHTINDTIVIMSLTSINANSNVLGYRIHNDIFNRTHFKRLSKSGTTYLTQELRFTDTEIHVADAEALMTPNKKKKIPGVVIIDGERIEYFKVQNNILKQLRRSTLGTAPSAYSEIGTKVIDQSINQTIPYSERLLKQKHKTVKSVNTYSILTTSTQLTGDGITLSTGTFYADLISANFDKDLARTYGELTLNMAQGIIPTDNSYDINNDNTITVADAILYLEISAGSRLDIIPPAGSKFYDIVRKNYEFNAIDQVEVFYGGRKLNKHGYYYQDISLSHDTSIFNIKGNVSTIEQLPTTATFFDAYLVTSTNQVWVFENLLNEDSFNGYKYRGLDYLEPEFTINTSTQEIILNIRSGVQDNVNLVIIKKEFDKSSLWNIDSVNSTTVSLLESVSKPAKFLQKEPAELPNDYYYGGSRFLLDGNGFVLTDDDGNSLEQ